jgi:Co/Zn/Cd efflux system component
MITPLAPHVASRSLGLLADALDMGADAGVYALSLASVGTAAARKKRLARTGGFVQLGLVEVIRRFFGSGIRGASDA